MRSFVKLTDLLSSIKTLNKNGQTIDFSINLTVCDLFRSCFVVELAGVEPASEITLPSVLHV
nr:MAG TPA: hypothetical protein [Caudoviricetes sp.]